MNCDTCVFNSGRIGSTAETQGLLQGDEILAIDGKRIANVNHNQVVQMLTDSANNAYSVTLGATHYFGTALLLLCSPSLCTRTRTLVGLGTNV